MKVIGETIRRRVNNCGHEIVLQKIERSRFSKQNRNLVLAVDFKNQTRGGGSVFIARTQGKIVTP